MGVDLTVAQGFVIALMCAFCGFVGFALGWTRAVAYESNRRIMKMSTPKDQRQNRKKYDTERNIGGMFGNIVRELCPPFAFTVESYHQPNTGYIIRVWPRPGGERVFTMVVSLDYDEETQICGTMGENRQYKSSISEPEVAKLRDEVTLYLQTL